MTYQPSFLTSTEYLEKVQVQKRRTLFSTSPRSRMNNPKLNLQQRGVGQTLRNTWNRKGHDPWDHKVQQYQP